MLQFVREHVIAAGFDHSHISKIELAIEEALVNIISYSYVDRRGIIDINCVFPVSAGIKIIIRDKGIPYNPLMNAKSFDINAPLEARSIGGYGVFIILKIMDEVDYHRENNFNILTLTKYIS